jgi:hypothetical protein
MITDAVLDVAFDALLWIISLFPDNELELSGIGEGAGYMSWVGMFVDTTMLAWALGIIVGGEASLLTVRLVLWVYKLLPLT